MSDECYLLIDFSGTTCLLQIPSHHAQDPLLSPQLHTTGLFAFRFSGPANRAICVVQGQHFFQIHWSLGLISVPCDVQMSKRQLGSTRKVMGSSVIWSSLALTSLTWKVGENSIFLIELLWTCNVLCAVFSPWYGFNRCGSFSPSVSALPPLWFHFSRFQFLPSWAGLEQTLWFLPALNFLVPKTKWLPCFPSLHQEVVSARRWHH